MLRHHLRHSTTLTSAARSARLSRTAADLRRSPLHRTLSATPRGTNATRHASTSTPPAQPSLNTSASTSTAIASTDLLDVYRGLVSQGRLTWDDEQVRVVMRLRHLLDELADYEPPLDLVAKLGPVPPKRAGWWGSFRRGPVGANDEERALVRVLTGEEEIAALKTPKGILVTGPPGSGKSFLLSLLYAALPARKARHHYHAFTLGLYQRVFGEMERRRSALAAGPSPMTEQERAERAKELAGAKGWRSLFAGGRWSGGADEDAAEWDATWADPRETIPFAIAKEMILEYHVLYFDELQLLDATSAALLRDVLGWYWRLGGVVISCSNRVPDDLYHHGVQRDRMAGFLDALKGRCEVVVLDGGRDWRREAVTDTPEASVSSSIFPALPDRWLPLGDAAFDRAWDRHPGEAVSDELVVYGRRVPVPLVKRTEAAKLAGPDTDSACRFSFEELCETPLGPADYLTLASTYRTWYVDNVPVLLLKNKNEARRLINLIDALYESRCQLVVRAAARPEHLFFPDALDRSLDPEHHDLLEAEALSETLGAAPRANVSVYDGPEGAREHEDRTDRGSSFALMSIFTGEDERFAYKRAVSRLIEMSTSPAYALEPWIPLEPASRGWEVTDGAVTAAASSRILHRAESGLDRGSDTYATESGSRALGDAFTTDDTSGEPGKDGARTGGPRENAPHIREQQVWGVEENWGPKTGRWGKGARAYEDDERSGDTVAWRSRGTGWKQ